ncbi:AarF/UbiB family protein [Alkalimarinus sediminis]|uniref:AarF/UbiB family protein n=1 Tax=Alkalimarinus sediminis TaxID=1632866 RepID=A0A9E8HKZ9_9ALTE|nr:AarF/UbiB family protein [Alkalimarinus sediminis]UZW76560.1 AarF/UbiB family protein [Alkalimarinus sediminis]
MTEQESKKIVEVNLPVLKKRTDSVLKGAGGFAVSTVKLPKAFWPVAQLLIRENNVSREELANSLDSLFDALYQHPLSEHSRSFTSYLRKYKLLPNEESTENLIRFLVKQVVARSPVEIPDVIVEEFWSFFQELISAPELKGLVELNLDIVRLVLRTYEPLLVELINKVKQIRKVNQIAVSDMMQKSQILRGDLRILKRQIKAIRYIKPFLQTDPKDFSAQAEIISKMVREFGPLFIKMAQVAAANADLLPEEIASELRVFQEDVDPMLPEDVMQAFMEVFGKSPQEIYFNFDIEKPLKSGSIGSVYLAKKPMIKNGVEVLVPVIVKVARHNLEREFQMGSLAIELMLMSSQYWAPHSKLLPFLSAMSEQIKEFTKGFEQELNFEDEAAIQRRFITRSQKSNVWHVPQLYFSSGRILEMEFLDDAMAIKQAINEHQGKNRNRFQRKVAENFLFTILEHLIIHQEFHGDLHPGNIMVDADAQLYLIDWGNAVDMNGKWALIWNYLTAVLAGDSDSLARVLIDMSTDPTANELRFDEIKKALDETLAKKQITPLDKRAIITLYREGQKGLHRRFQASLQLMSNTYQLGIVMQSDYLHLSRSIVAMAGTYLNMYDGVSKLTMAVDLLKDLSLFPANLIKDRVSLKGGEVRRMLSVGE